MKTLFFYFVCVFLMSGCVSYNGASYMPMGVYSHGYRPAYPYAPTYHGYGNYLSSYSPAFGGYRTGHFPIYGGGQYSPFGGGYQGGYQPRGVYAPYGGRWAEYWTAGRDNWQMEANADWSRAVHQTFNAP